MATDHSERFAAAALRPASRPPRSRPWPRLVARVRRAVCRLRGHKMATRFEPDRLFLQCLACGAQTSGWTLELTPPRLPSAVSSARVLPFAPRTASATTAPRRAA